MQLIKGQHGLPKKTLVAEQTLEPSVSVCSLRTEHDPEMRLAFDRWKRATLLVPMFTVYEQNPGQVIDQPNVPYSPV